MRIFSLFLPFCLSDEPVALNEPIKFTVKDVKIARNSTMKIGWDILFR